MSRSLSAATLTASGGTASRALSAKLGDVLSVKDFGAVGDGVTDDAAAIQAALAAGNAYFPPGTYIVGSAITASASRSLRGAGSSVVELRFSGTDGLSLFADSGSIYYDIEGLKLTTTAAGAGTALRVNYSTASGLNSQQVRVRDVIVDRVSSTGFWSAGVHVTNARNSVFEAVHVSGYRTGSQTLYGFRVDGEATDARFIGCMVLEVDVAWSLEGTVEGTTLAQCIAVHTRKGVVKSHAGGEPWLGLSHCHLNCSEVCVDLSNGMQSFIDSCLLYACTFGTMPGWTGVRIDGASARDIVVSNTTFHGSAYTGTRTGISLVNGTRYQLIGNIHLDQETAVSVASACSAVSVLGGRYSGVTTQLSDTGNRARVLEVGSDGNWEVNSTSNTYLRIVSSLAAFLRMVDSGASANQKTMEWVFDGGALKLRNINDDGTTRNTFARIADGAVSIGGDLNGEGLRVGQGSYANRIDVNGASSGGSPNISAAGSDTNINLKLTPKGTGRLQVTAFTANADAPITGYIEVLDSGGTVRKLAVIA